MIVQVKDKRRSQQSKIAFIASLLTLIICCLGQLVNVYHFAFVGAIFEMLWLPLIALIFILPVVSLSFWVIEQFRLKSFYLYSLLISVATILVLIFLP